MYTKLLFGFFLSYHCLSNHVLRSFEMYTEEPESEIVTEYWETINWYLGHISFMVVTLINENDESYDLSQKFIERIFKDGRSVKLEKFNKNYEEPFLSYSDTFDWQGNQFELRSTETHLRMKRHQTYASSIEASNEDHNEPIEGNVVISINMSVMADYLFGTPRKPFNDPRRYYILAIEQAENDWKTIGSRFLEKLWYQYGISSVLLTAPYLNQSEDNLAIYNPFELKTAQKNYTKKYGVTKWTTIKKLFRDNTIFKKFQNLNNFPLKISQFYRYPTSLWSRELPKALMDSYFSNEIARTNGYAGFDGVILGNIAKSMNFTPIIVTTNESYGHPVDNNTFVGAMGDILYRRAYIAFNGRFVTDYGTNEIEFAFPSYFDKFCLIAPKALKIPQWMAIFKCFNVYVWGIILLSNTVCGYFWYLLRQWALKKSKCTHHYQRITSNVISEEYNRYSVISIEMWILMLSGTIHYRPRQIAERIFLCTCLFANIIIAGSFQGSLTTSFSTTSYFKDIDTLGELDKSGLAIATTSNSLGDIFGESTSPTIKSLKKKFKILKGIPIINRTATTRDVCCIERSSDINVIVATSFTAPDGSLLLHPIKECPRAYYLSYIVKRGWPLLPILNIKIQRLFESGIVYKWYQHIEASIILDVKSKNVYSGDKRNSAFSLIDMQTAFYCWGIGLLFCMMIFGIEIILENRINSMN